MTGYDGDKENDMINIHAVEDKITAAIDRNNDLIVPYILMVGWLYEVADTSMVSDHYWDQLCVRYGEIKDNVTHFHKKFIPDDIGSDASASAFAYDIHNRTVGAAIHFAYENGSSNGVKSKNGFWTGELDHLQGFNLGLAEKNDGPLPMKDKVCLMKGVYFNVETTQITEKQGKR